MPTIDGISQTATASTVDTDDYFLVSVDGTVSRISAAELLKVANTSAEVAVAATTYTLLSTDQGKVVRASHVDAKTFTIPATSGFIIGLPIVIRNASATDITIAGDTGVTLNAASLTIGENESIALIPRATDEWDVYTGGTGGSLTQLSTPTLTMTAASDTAMDFSWTNVANESSYEVDIAEDSGFTVGVQSATPAADDTAHQFTGLTASTTYYGRVRAIGDGVSYSNSAYGTDSEATSAGSGYDAESTAYFTAESITDAGEKAAVDDNLVKGLKADSLFTDHLIIYPFLGTGHDRNLMSPGNTNGDFRITYNGGWTHNAAGSQGNGTNGYGQTWLIPSVDLAATDCTLWVAISATIVGDRCIIGGYDANGHSRIEMTDDGGAKTAGEIDGNTTAAFAGNGTGIWIVTRNANDISCYKDGVLISTQTVAPTGKCQSQLFLSALNYVSGGSIIRYTDAVLKAVGVMAAGINGTQAGNLNTRVQAYLTDLGR